MTTPGVRIVLTVLLDYPLPATTGLNMRTIANLDAVARVSDRTEVLWFSTEDRRVDDVDVAMLLEHCDAAHHGGARVEQHQLSRRYRALAKIGFALSGLAGRRARTYPYAMRYDAAAVEDVIVAQVEATGADTVILPSQGMHWMRALPDSVSVIIDAADVLTDVTIRLARTSTGPRTRRLGLWANHIACRSQERRYLAQADEVWATTETEADRFRELVPTCRTVVVPNAVQAAPAPERVGEPPAFGMLATWSYRPNTDALNRLLDEILPRIVAVDPDITMVIAGAGLTAEQWRRCDHHEQIDVLGTIDNVADFYSRVDVVALPITVRGGMPLKLAEAMARGRAIVASPELIAGVSVTDGHDLIVADTDDAFAEAIDCLLHDDLTRRSMVAAAHGVQQRLYSLDALDTAIERRSLLCVL